jgi:hypothetical protein
LTLPIAFFITGLMLFSVTVLARFSRLRLNFTEWGDFALVGTFSLVLLGLVAFLIWYLWWDPTTTTKLTIADDMQPPREEEIDNRTPRIEATVTDKDTGLPPLKIRLFVDRREVTEFAYDCESGRLTCDRAELGIGKRHTVEVVATDAHDKQTTEAWEFGVRSQRRRQKQCTY